MQLTPEMIWSVFAGAAAVIAFLWRAAATANREKDQVQEARVADAKIYVEVAVRSQETLARAIETLERLERTSCGSP